MPQACFGVLGTVIQEFPVFEDADALTVFQETHFESPGREDGYTDECVRGSINDGDSSEYGSKVGKMSAEEARAVSEFYMERLIPALGLQVEFHDHVWVCNRYVGAGIHYPWFIDDCRHARCYGSSVLGWFLDL